MGIWNEYVRLEGMDEEKYYWYISLLAGSGKDTIPSHTFFHYDFLFSMLPIGTKIL